MDLNRRHLHPMVGLRLIEVQNLFAKLLEEPFDRQPALGILYELCAFLTGHCKVAPPRNSSPLVVRGRNIFSGLPLPTVYHVAVVLRA